MNIGEKDVVKLHRTTGTLLSVFIVPTAYFVGSMQGETASFWTLISLIFGGYLGCLMLAFLFVKIFGKWLPDNG